jgi:hypothetical protein
MLQGCTAGKLPSSDHFDGSRFHNRAGGSGYSLWQEVKIAWELRTEKKNWPARFQTTPYRAPAEPVLHGIRVLWIGHSTTVLSYYLVRRFYLFQAWLLVGTAGIVAVTLVAALSGVDVARCLIILMLAPAVTVVGSEAWITEMRSP